jgi:hypothetical protein
MGKSKNTNPNIYRSKWDLAEDLETDYRRSDRKRIIQEQLEEFEEMEEEEEFLANTAEAEEKESNGEKTI